LDENLKEIIKSTDVRFLSFREAKGWNILLLAGLAVGTFGSL